MARPGLRIARIGGVPLYVSAGWAFVFIVLIVLFTPTTQRFGLDLASAVALAATIPLMLAISVLLHELAHGITAQKLGYKVTEYVLSLWGGHTAFGSEISAPGRSALVAVVGPLANVAIAVVCWPLSQATTNPYLGLVLVAASSTNAIVAVFNLLPAIPMDGGRLLEAAIWKATGDKDRGTLVAARAGQAVAVVIAGYALLRVASSGGREWTTIIWGMFIAATLWQGASASVRYARARIAARATDLRPLSMPVTTLAADTPVSALTAVTTPMVVLAGPTGLPVGYVDPAAVAQVPDAARTTTPLSAVAARLPAQALLVEHQGTAAVSGLALAARAGAKFVILLDQHRRAVAAVDIVTAAKQLPR